MKILTNTIELKNFLGKALKVNMKLNTIPENESILINASNKNKDVIISINNLNTCIERVLDANIEEEGQVLIPLNSLKIINKIKNDNQVTITDKEIIIGFKVIKYRSLNTDVFYKYEKENSKELFTIKENELYRMLEVSYATATDDTRPILQGINIRKNKFCALDGYRVSIRESQQFNIDKDITLSMDLWKTLLKVIDKKSEHEIKIKFNNYDNKIIFEFKEFTMIGLLLGEEFIKYESFILKEEKINFKFNVKEILEILNFDNEVLKDVDKHSKIIRFNLNKDELTLKVENYDNLITDTINVINKDDVELEFAFNIKYILEAIKINKDKETLYLKGISNTNIFTITKDNKNIELILPVRINK